MGKDFKKNNLEYCSKWLAIEYKKLDRSLIGECEIFSANCLLW